MQYKLPKDYISGSDPTPTLSIALPEIELEQIELNLNLGSADLGTLKAKSIQADLASAACMRMSCKQGSWMQRLPWAVQSLAPCRQSA